MTKHIIPINPEPNQSFEIDLNGQQCDFKFLTRGTFLYMYLKVNKKDFIDGIICLNGNNLIQKSYGGFKGKIYFEDTQGDLPPIYYGLNDRWILYYEDER